MCRRSASPGRRSSCCLRVAPSMKSRWRVGSGTGFIFRGFSASTLGFRRRLIGARGRSRFAGTVQLRRHAPHPYLSPPGRGDTRRSHSSFHGVKRSPQKNAPISFITFIPANSLGVLCGSFSIRRNLRHAASFNRISLADKQSIFALPRA